MTSGGHFLMFFMGLFAPIMNTGSICGQDFYKKKKKKKKVIKFYKVL